MEITLKDIVEQLRMRDMPLCVEAAAEIERLREALQGMLDDEPGAAQFAVRALEPKP